MAFTRNAVRISSAVLFVTYTCSRCGVQNLAEHTLKASGSASSFMGFQMDKARDKAESMARDKLTRRLLTIQEEQKKGRYRTVQFGCRCEKCGSREPWARMRYSGFQVMLVLLTIAMAFGALFLAAWRWYSPAVLLLAACVFMWICFFALRAGHTRRMEAMTAMLPEKCLPAFSQDAQEIAAEMGRRRALEHNELVIEKKLLKKMKGKVNS